MTASACWRSGRSATKPRQRRRTKGAATTAGGAHDAKPSTEPLPWRCQEEQRAARPARRTSSLTALANALAPSVRWRTFRSRWRLEAHLLPRPVGLRQDHAVARHCGPRGAGCRPRRDRRPRRQPSAAGAARLRHRLPVLCAVSQPDRCAERRLRAGQPAQATRRGQGARGGDADARRADRARHKIPCTTFGRPAAARGACPSAGILAVPAAPRRTAVRARCAGPRAAARGDQDAAAAASASPPSWSHTTRKRRWRWPTASW